MKKNEFASSYIEAIAVDHCKRWARTYYIKGNKGEIDIALVIKNRIYPIEVKWSNYIRPEDIKQIKHYKSGIILTINPDRQKYGDNLMIPLVRFLIHVSAAQYKIV